MHSASLSQDSNTLNGGSHEENEEGKAKFRAGTVGDPAIHAIWPADRFISTLPEIPGVLVHSDGHIGIYIGDGYAIEAMGTRYGVVKTRVANRNWTGWCKNPYIDYIEEESEQEIEQEMEPSDP